MGATDGAFWVGCAWSAMRRQGGDVGVSMQVVPSRSGGVESDGGVCGGRSYVMEAKFL